MGIFRQMKDMRGWNARMKANPAVAQRFSQLYRAS
jgi:hypothetical protein